MDNTEKIRFTQRVANIVSANNNGPAGWYSSIQSLDDLFRI